MTFTTLTTEQREQAWRIAPADFYATAAKFAKINERAAKKGLNGSLSIIGERVEREVTNEITGTKSTVVEVLSVITGDAPVYNGWKFLARVDAIWGKDGIENFTLATAPGVDHVDREQVTPGVCGHCSTARRRKNTYLVQNVESGEITNVGSTCIKDFLGWEGNFSFTSTDEVTEQEIGGWGQGYQTYNVDSVLTASLAAIRAFGWVPSSSYDSKPTASWVRLILGFGRPTKDEEAALRTLRPFAEEANEKAATIREFILSEEFSGQSTYVDNLKVACSVHAVEGNLIGILASAPRAYIRHLETEAERKAQQARWDAEKAARAASEYIGQVGDKKVEIKGTITSIRYIQGDYGTTVLYTIHTAEGNVVKWFASREALGEDEGVEVHILGTVKKHEEYQGTKATILTRCKVA